MKLSLVESRLFGRICYGYRRDKQGLLKLCRRKRKLSELFLGSTEPEIAWTLFRAIYLPKEFLLPLEKYNGAEMY